MGTRFLVAGLINLETTVQVDGFPIPYQPVRYPFHGVRSTVSGVGYNVAKALITLGDEVRCLSLIGRDPAGQLVRQALATDGIPGEGVCDNLAETPQSAILYDAVGRRQINVDLKDIQEQTYPAGPAAEALSECQWALLCNINFARPMLAAARLAGKPIATDVHALADLDDAYNQDYMRATEVLFLSNEQLPLAPEAFARQLGQRFGTPVVVVGLGAQGALLALRGGYQERLPAVRLRPVVNTIGAGDALFSSFVHDYARFGDAQRALRRAMVFAAWKIGATGAADGFLTEAELDERGGPPSVVSRQPAGAGHS